MKVLVIGAVIAIAACFASSSQAGNPSLCVKDGWASAQSDSGARFASMKECAKSRDVFSPALSISPTHVDADERYVLSASGFHANTYMTIYFAITGQDPYGSYTPFYPTNADGSFSIPFVFAACSNSPDDLTITLIDSFGVHASASLTLC